MIDLSTFIDYLSQRPPLKPIAINYIGERGKQLNQWTVSLSMLSIKEQCLQIEKVLSQMIISNMSNDEKIALMEHILVTVDRVISQIHTHYFYEMNFLTSEQKTCAKQAKSLYYLCILVYHSIFNRSHAKNSQSSPLDKSGWKSLIPFGKPQKNTLAVSIFQMIGLYIRLLIEYAIAYEKPPEILWSQLNHLYLTAIQEGLTQLTINRHYSFHDASNIEQHYCQACLVSLLNFFSYRRQDILHLYKILPKWAEKIQLQNMANAQSKVFVNLQGNHPPEHITPYATVNPYDSKLICLFIDLQPLEGYLHQLEQLTNNDVDGQITTDMNLEVRLAKMALLTLQHSHFQLSNKISRNPTSIRRTGHLVTGFYRLHYYLSGKSSLSNLIHENKLASVYHCKHQPSIKFTDANSLFFVDILNKDNASYHFQFNKCPQPEQNHTNTPPPPPRLPLNMQVLSMFALQTAAGKKNHTWEIGIIRWIENNDNNIQAGGDIIGYSATACGIRLASNDGRSQDFVPALLIAGNHKLGTKTTLMIPRYHFKTSDKVVMRIADKQTHILLKHKLFGTDDIEQYEILRLVNRQSDVSHGQARMAKL